MAIVTGTDLEVIWNSGYSTRTVTIRSSHSYAVTRSDADGGVWMRNPWGRETAPTAVGSSELAPRMSRPISGVPPTQTSPIRTNYWFENTESNAAAGGSHRSERMYLTASAAPCSRSIPASSHSMEMGPV